MVLYSLNPNDDEGLNSVIGCFQDGTPLGRIQQGSAWWFNDHKAGMVKQLTAFANGGLLGNFIGMLTDSRSFLSYPRHEYFRLRAAGRLGGKRRIPRRLESPGEDGAGRLLQQRGGVLRLPPGKGLSRKEGLPWKANLAR